MKLGLLTGFVIALSAIIAGFAQAQTATGLIFDEDDTYRSIPLAAKPLQGALPASIDHSGMFPVPGQQGNQGSCVGWAVSYLKSFQETKERAWGRSTPQTQFSPSYIYNQVKISGCTPGGAHFSDALNLLRREGVATIAQFPYDPQTCSARPSDAVKRSAQPYAISDWRRVNVQDEIEVKEHLAAGFPVLVGLSVDDGFSQLGRETYTQRSGASRGGHAMVVVGFDDNRSAFKLINSWGRNWGENGFGWIDYTTFRRMARQGYVAHDIIIDPIPPRPPVTPDPLPPQPNPQPQPTPQPLPPLPQLPIASQGGVAVQHNVMVQSPQGMVIGMRIIPNGTIRNAQGKMLVVQAGFTYWGGPPLMANPMDGTFRDTTGRVSTGTIVPVAQERALLSGIGLTIPYYALNFMPTNGMAMHNLGVSVTLSVDGRVISTSPPTAFSFRW